MLGYEVYNPEDEVLVEDDEGERRGDWDDDEHDDEVETDRALQEVHVKRHDNHQ